MKLKLSTDKNLTEKKEKLSESPRTEPPMSYSDWQYYRQCFVSTVSNPVWAHFQNIFP